jgi:hypothetical protein
MKLRLLATTLVLLTVTTLSGCATGKEATNNAQLFVALPKGTLYVPPIAEGW